MLNVFFLDNQGLFKKSDLETLLSHVGDVQPQAPAGSPSCGPVSQLADVSVRGRSSAGCPHCGMGPHA
jgi:hypothetical protein